MSDIGSLLDLGGSERNCDNVNSGQLNLILDIFGSHIFYTIWQRHFSYTPFSQEVTDFDVSSSTVDIDGEMRVYKSHLVKESSGDTDDHVLDMRAHSANTGELLARSEPQVDLNVILFNFCAINFFSLGDLAAFHWNVLELTFKGTKLSGYLDFAAFYFHLD